MASGDSRHIEQIIEQTGHGVNLAINHGGCPVPRFCIRQRRAQHFGGAAYRRQRITQLVRQDRQKFVLAPIRFAQCLFTGGECQARDHPIRDLGSHHENSSDGGGACHILYGVVNKVYIARLDRLGGIYLHLVLQSGGDVGLTAVINTIEQLQVALGDSIGKRFRYRAAENVSIADQVAIAGIRQFEAVLGPAQHRHKRRCLLEQIGEPLALFTGTPGGEYVGGGLRTNDQHTANAERRAFVVDRPIAIGPIDLLDDAVSGDRHQRVLMGHRTPAGQDMFDFRANDVPDFLPDLAGGAPQRTGVPL